MLKRLADIHPFLLDIVLVASILLASALAYWLSRRFLVSAVHLYAKRSVQTWDDVLVRSHVFSRLAQLVPAYIIYESAGLVPGLSQFWKAHILNLSSAYAVVILTVTVTAMLGAANHIYELRPNAKNIPVKGFVQLLQLAALILGGVLFIAALLDQSPVLLLSGLGAMTAVLLLIFKDTILSLVASVQLSARNMVCVGDWIEVPQFNADGDVVDVELHTIKVQNWDKTITTIPTHQLISGSFKNWRGMANAGGRRIKRALSLDTVSIRFLSEAEVERFKRFTLLKAYIENKQRKLEDFNIKLASETKGDPSDIVNLQSLTNAGVFRAYIFNYLKHHPQVHQDMTWLVRQLTPGPAGLPMELYCFTTTTEWLEYEDIQGDIFDHLLAIVPEFGLRLYQQPAGSDLAALSHLVRHSDNNGIF